MSTSESSSSMKAIEDIEDPAECFNSAINLRHGITSNDTSRFDLTIKTSTDKISRTYLHGKIFQ